MRNFRLNSVACGDYDEEASAAREGLAVSQMRRTFGVTGKMPSGKRTIAGGPKARAERKGMVEVPRAA